MESQNLGNRGSTFPETILVSSKDWVDSREDSIEEKFVVDLSCDLRQISHDSFAEELGFLSLVGEQFHYLTRAEERRRYLKHDCTIPEAAHEIGDLSI